MNLRHDFVNTTPALLIRLMIRRSSFLFLWIAVLTLPVPMFGQIEKATVELTDGTEFTSTIASIENEQLRVTGNSKFDEISLKTLLSIQTADTPTKPRGEIRVELLQGGFLYVDQLQLADERMEIKSTAHPQLSSLKLESIRGIRFSGAHNAPLFQDRSKENDVVYVKTDNGEVQVTGFLEGITPTHVLLNFRGQSRKISREKIVAVVTADLELPPLQGTVATSTLADGSRLAGNLVKLDKNLEVVLPGGSRALVPSGDVVRIQFESDALAYLSDLNPVEVEIQPLFAPQREWRRNRSVGNNPLTLRNTEQEIQTFSKGIGTMSFSRIVFSNTKDFDRLQAVVGIDTETGGRGDCLMSIRGDGVELWSSRIKATDPFLPVDVSVKGIQRIELIVEPGESFDLADHANWCNARLIQTR